MSKLDWYKKHPKTKGGRRLYSKFDSIPKYGQYDKVLNDILKYKYCPICGKEFPAAGLFASRFCKMGDPCDSCSGKLAKKEVDIDLGID